MSKTWDKSAIQLYITDEIEESLELDYKAAGSLAKTDGKRTEITKDVSAMANSAGGIIIYGLREDPAKKHLAELIDPIDRTQFSKEWLEHVINNIRPKIHGIIIHPVSLSTSSDDVVYVVEIPQSTTAHQSTDKRYYRRFNFESIAMEDHEIRDVMNRAAVPDASVEFRFKDYAIRSKRHEYILQPIITNLGGQVINNFKLSFNFPHFLAPLVIPGHPSKNINVAFDKFKNYDIHYHSETVLFPNEERDISEEIHWRYEVNSEIYGQLRNLELSGNDLMIPWKLYADNMIPKSGNVPFSTLNKY